MGHTRFEGRSYSKIDVGSKQQKSNDDWISECRDDFRVATSMHNINTQISENLSFELTDNRPKMHWVYVPVHNSKFHVSYTVFATVITPHLRNVPDRF